MIQRSRRQPIERVAFYAIMSHDEPDPGKHHTIVFDTIQTNVGNGYNNYSGIFTVPVSGVYSFSWSIANICQSEVFTVLVVNNEEVGAIATDTGPACDHGIATGQAVLSLQIGQIVFVRTHSTNAVVGAIVSRDFNRSTFSGFLLS